MLNINTILDLGLLAQLFSAERVKALQPTDKADRTNSCFANSGEISEVRSII